MQSESETNSIFEKLRPVMMGLTSILLCFSIIMSAFTAYPLSMAGIIYGKRKSLIMIGMSCLFCYAISQVAESGTFLFVLYLFHVLIGVGIIETFNQKIDPVKGIFYIGLVATLSVLTVGTMYLSSKGYSPSEFVKAEIMENQVLIENIRKKLEVEGNKNTEQLQKILMTPDLLKDVLIKEIPSLFLVSFLAMTWLNMFLILRSTREGLHQKEDCTIQKLLNFQMPDYFIWVVIALLAGYLFGEKVNYWVPIISITSLKALAVFYFMQGFGIYIEFINIIKLRGFFRSFLIVMTILTAGEILALVGLFDMFVNFRKLLKNKLNRGD